MLTSLDGQPYSYPAPVYVQNTFVQCVTRTQSFDDFFEERQIRSCPANCAPQATVASPLTAGGGAVVRSGASFGDLCNVPHTRQVLTDPIAPTTLNFAAPCAGYTTMVTAPAVEMASASPTSCPTTYTLAYPDHTDAHPYVPTAAMPYTPYSQPGYVADYALHPVPEQHVASLQEQQMRMGQALQPPMQQSVDMSMSMHYRVTDYGDQVQIVQPNASLSRNSPAVPGGQMFAHSSFNEYQMQGVCYPMQEYPPPPPPPPQQPPMYDNRGGENMGYAQMGAGGSVPDGALHSIVSPQAGPYQMNMGPNFQNQGLANHSTFPGPVHGGDKQFPQFAPEADGQQCDSAGFPRLVLQLSAAINEQQQQQQRLQQQQQQQQRADYFPPSAPLSSTQPTSSGQANGVASVGSLAHDMGKCKPCAFMYTKGCENGLDCQFCHICEPGEKKKRRKEKLESRRTVRQLRSALTGGISEWWEGFRGGRQNDQNSPPDLHENR